MRFMWEGVKYECIGMPFGMAPAPRLATKLFAPVMRYLHHQGLWVSVNIDNLVILAHSMQRFIAHTQLVRWTPFIISASLSIWLSAIWCLFPLRSSWACK